VLTTIAIENYRSIRQLVLPLSALNVITGVNGSGKSNLYRALKLLADTARGGVISSIAFEGGLQSTFWAGPETVSPAMLRGEVPVQGTVRKDRVQLKLGFAAEDFSYSIALGLPPPSLNTAFTLDPEVKRECIWAGPTYRPASALTDRVGPVLKLRRERRWEIVHRHVSTAATLFDHGSDPSATPEIFTTRESIRGWRFYDQFRTDRDAPARQSQLGTKTPVLHHDGHDIAAAIQTIIEIGEREALHAAIDDAFPGASVQVIQSEDLFTLQFNQPGLLRPLTAAELSDGTLRYLLFVAALLTPRPPPLIVLNEPETSLHPDLLPSLGNLILSAAQKTQILVVSHAGRLVAALQENDQCHSIELEKQLGQTKVQGMGMLDGPSWKWPH